MKYYCGISIAPIRKEPSDRSEMVSQLLFGEQFIVIEKFKGWYLVELMYDGYEGWVDARIAIELIEDINGQYIKNDLQVKYNNKENSCWLSYGSELILGNNGEIVSVFGTFQFQDLIEKSEKSFRNRLDSIIHDCQLFLNVPYLWGGRSAFGIDCSGLLQVVHKVNGVFLPRDASEQAKIGLSVEYNDSKKGDLAYFSNLENKITHVGILLNKHEILHSSGWVRIDKFTNSGIISPIDNIKSHHLAFIKRLSYTA